MTDPTTSPTDADADAADEYPRAVQVAPAGTALLVPQSPRLPEPWDEAARTSIRENAEAAPPGYHVRAWFSAMGGDLLDVVAVPRDAAVGGSPRLKPYGDTPNTADLHPAAAAAVYEVRVPRVADLSAVLLDAYEEECRARHERFIEQVVDGDVAGTGRPPVYTPDLAAMRERAGALLSDSDA